MGGGLWDDSFSNDVHQATGMIAAQLQCDVDEAFARLRIRAAATNQTLQETALDVVGRVIRFDN